MAREKAYLVILEYGKKPRGFLRDSLEEMTELTQSAGGIVAGSSTAVIQHPSPSHFIREGKIEEVRREALKAGAQLIIFNLDLRPGQARNLETACALRIVDRTGLVLDIFARRAISHEGKLQVELAQLQYLLPRLVGQGVIMSRLGGGIGTRGPGEQKLEVDRRKIRARIQRVKEDLKKLETHRSLLRSGRREKGFVQVAIVGYTNAGKTTLLNVLTGAKAYTADQLFATLDPKTRAQTVNGRRDMLFTDTVGFIRDLPPFLIEAFHATLEEVAQADLIIHVVDASHPQALEQKKVAEGILRDLKADGKPTRVVLNKADRIMDEEKGRIQLEVPEGIWVSAKEKRGLQVLIASLEVLSPEEPVRR